MAKNLTLLFLLSFATVNFAQKTVHIPNYLQDPNNVDGSQFSWNKTAQSDNFILIWGNTVGTNPAIYPDPNLAFSPTAILDTMEYIYDQFKLLEFLDDAPGTNLHQYKIPIVIYGTWGANGAQGFANGGDADGIIGAFWVHPNAMHDGGVAAHELTHSLQAQAVIDYRTSHGLGPVWNNAGIFWETHGNFMRNLLYPQFVTAWGMDVYHLETWGDWKNTYENYELLLGIMESEGIGMVNRLWRESLSNEYPLAAYKRLAGYNQQTFNDSLFRYARRMATFDFNYKNIGQYFRQYRNQDLNNYLPSIQRTYSILKKVPGAAQRYEMPEEAAPEEFAYNIIPLYPEAGACAVVVKFKGHTANTHAGWRYGFVAANSDGIVSRYSPVYSDNTAEIHFKLEGAETKLYLVIMGAPADQITTNSSNDTWKGYPKHFRFPYEVSISGALPEGFQTPASFRSQLKTGGHLHSNGGGWVKNTATVAASVYVGPMAMVLGNANLSGQVRLENTALVRNATMSGQVKVIDNAFVDGGTYSGNAIIKGLGFAENATMLGNAVIDMRAKVTNYDLSGNIEVGGDVVVYNENGSCNNGVYYRLTNYYDDKLLECDNRTATHPANLNVNSVYALFSNEEMAVQCQCAPGTPAIAVDSMSILPPACSNANSGSVTFHISNACGPFNYNWSNGITTGSGLEGLSSGEYQFTVTDNLGRTNIFPVQIPNVPVLSGSLSSTAHHCENSGSGTAQVTIDGGTAPFQYFWNDGNGSTTASIGNLLPGTYSVTATDVQGCTFTGSTTVPLSGELAWVLTIMPVHCHDGADASAALAPLGGIAPYGWLWETGEVDSLRTNLVAGAYALTVTDAAGCSAGIDFDIVSPPELLLQAATVQSSSCFGAGNGSAAVTVTGGTPGYYYVWNTQDTTALIAGLHSGAYSVTVTDEYGCTNATTVYVTSPADLFLHVQGPAMLCPQEPETLIAGVDGGTGPYSYLWSDNTVDSVLNVTGNGIYTVSVSDANGCTQTASIAIAPGNPLVLNGSGTPVHCFGGADGSLSVVPGSGVSPYNWLWQTGATDSVYTGLAAGTYFVTVTDALGCSDVLQLPVGSPPPLEVAIATQDVSCSGGIDGSISLTVNGGVPDYTYHWNNGQTGAALTGLQAGEYQVTVTDMKDCTDTSVITITAPEPLIIHLSSLVLICPGKEATIIPDAIGGTLPYTFAWDNGQTEQVLVTGPGNYILTVSDGHNCTRTAGITVDAYNSIQAVAHTTPATSASAMDGGIDLVTVSGGSAPPYQLLWSNGGTTGSIYNLAPGIYTLTVTDFFGCEAVFIWEVTWETTATTDLTDLQQVQIVPNPSAGNAHVWINSRIAQDIQLLVYNALGELVYRKNEFLTTGQQSLALPEGISSGVYRVVLRDGNDKIMIRTWIAGD